MIHVITLGFAPARILSEGLYNFYGTHTIHSDHFKHYVLDQHYPLNRSENLELMRGLCAFFAIELIDSGCDRGLHDGFNFAVSQIKPKPGDVLIMYDPDSGPLVIGWDSALVETIRAGYAVAGLVHETILQELTERGSVIKFVGGHKILEPVTNCQLSVCAWNFGFFEQIGGFTEENKFYGGLESSTWNKLISFGRKWAYLADFNESRDLRYKADPEYTAWKWAHSRYKTFTGSFAEYVAAGCPLMTETLNQIPESEKGPQNGTRQI